MEVWDNQAFFLDQIDDASAALILELQREDIEELQRSSKGKNREDEVSDIDLAVQLYHQDLEQTSAVLTDRCMSRSLARAVIADSALLTDVVKREDTFANDRLMAERLRHGDEVECSKEASSEDAKLDDLLIARLTALYVSGSIVDCDSPVVDEEESTTSESSRWAAARAPPPKKGPSHECVACGEQKRAFETFRAPCSHNYCQDCLAELFELSTTDETLFPPRCCRQAIPLTPARLYLSRDLVQRFQQKAVEFRSNDRTYCSRPTCSAFITSADIAGERATCTTCLQQTCTICKGNCHNGDCPQDTATQQVLAAAQEQGWQRCYNCRRLVELDIGCNHMTYVLRGAPV
ncbi:MAG: hypothetical protein Q9171_005280 [Xanthocarpia ochracea]